MNRRMTKFLRFGGEILCFMLIFSMLLCSIPMFAQESAETEKADKPKTVKVVKLVTDVNRGTRIYEEDVEVVEVKNENIPSNIISDPAEIDSLFAKTDLYAGEYIADYQVSESSVAKANEKLLKKPINKAVTDFVNVTDYIVPNTNECLAVYLQEIIDANPKRTIYFPDGEYVISNPLLTSGAGRDSVSIQLADGAVIKASKNFKDRGGNALICMGGAKNANDIVSVGSYYSVMGGTLDGNNVTNGISIVSGRESLIRNICIKNAKVGIYVAPGANNGSSDLDFEDITIIGSGMIGSVGLSCDGYDNTFTNFRIYNVTTGMNITSGGNLLKSIYVYNDPAKLPDSVPTEGLKLKSNNWISQCRVVNANTAFSFGAGSMVWDCSAEWTTSDIESQTMFLFSGNNLTVSGCRADFCVAGGVATALVQGNCNVKFIEATAFNENDVTNKAYKNFLTHADTIIPRAK